MTISQNKKSCYQYTKTLHIFILRIKLTIAFLVILLSNAVNGQDLNIFLEDTTYFSYHPNTKGHSGWDTDYRLKDSVIENGKLLIFYDKEHISLKNEFHFKDFIKNGKQKYFTEDGILKIEFNYLNGLMDGLQRRYYYDSGKLLSETMCEKGKNIETILYHRSGNISSKKIIFNDEFIQFSYYDNGQLADYMHYKNKKYQGNLRNIFYDNGNLKLQQFYTEGQIDSILEYHPNRMIKERTLNLNGQLSYRYRYRNDGELELIQDFPKAPDFKYVFIRYNLDGSYNKKVSFKNEILIDAEYDSKGVLLKRKELRE